MFVLNIFFLTWFFINIIMFNINISKRRFYMSDQEDREKELLGSYKKLTPESQDLIFSITATAIAAQEAVKRHYGLSGAGAGATPAGLGVMV